LPTHRGSSPAELHECLRSFCDRWLPALRTEQRKLRLRNQDQRRWHISRVLDIPAWTERTRVWRRCRGRRLGRRLRSWHDELERFSDYGRWVPVDLPAGVPDHWL